MPQGTSDATDSQASGYTEDFAEPCSVILRVGKPAP